jgi:hypothetical protein
MKNQNKTSMGPSEIMVPSWLSGPRTDVPTETLSRIHNLGESPKALTGPIFLYICLNLYFYDGIFIHSNEEIVRFFIPMITSK